MAYCAPGLPKPTQICIKILQKSKTPFALSLSKGRSFQKKEQGFDKLSPNGVEQIAFS
jgi:hypothetical protein